MDNVIQFPGSDKRKHFLKICEETLCEDDYLDLIDAINSIEFYRGVHPEIKEIVEAYFQCK
jgi:hypothetical protein